MTRPLQSTSRRGSVILMVVGLLTILSMLGAAFVLSSRLDARQARALTGSANPEYAAKGVMSMIQARLIADIRTVELDPNDPDGLKDSMEHEFTWYVDVPGPEVDEWLSSASPVSLESGAIVWPMVSALLRPVEECVNVEIPEDDAPLDELLVDTDGLMHGDALLGDTGAFGRNGEQYYVAVRIIDLSGRMTLGEVSSSDRAHDIGDYAVGFPEFETIPRSDDYDVTDEMAMLWPYEAAFVGPLAEKLLTAAGGNRQLASAPQVRALLTTRGGSEPLLRYPEWGSVETGDLANPSEDVPIFKPVPLLRDELDASSLPDDGVLDASSPEHWKVQELYENVLRWLPSDAGDREKRAAHFAINWYAAQLPRLPGLSDDAVPLAAQVSFKPDGKTWSVYGLDHQPFITEAYAAYKQNTDATSNDARWFCAVEVFNPYPKALEPDPSARFKISASAAPGASENIELKANRDPDSRKVYFNHSYDIGDLKAGLKTDFGWTDAQANLTDSWHRIDNDDFNLFESAIELKRGAAVLDKVSAAEIGAFDPNSVDFGDKQTISAQRDDRTDTTDEPEDDHWKLSVAAYVDKTTSGHTLGEQNSAVDLDSNEAIGGEKAGFAYPVEFGRRTDPDAPPPFRSVGDLTRVYFFGPDHDEGLPQKMLKDKDSPLRGRPDLFPSVQTGPDEAYDWTIKQAEWKLGAAEKLYPPIPWACMGGEMFRMLPVGRGGRLRGLVNINTAPREVLEKLPWLPQDGNNYYIDLNQDGAFDEDFDKKVTWNEGMLRSLADAIISYRSTANRSITGLSNLRAHPSECGPTATLGFMTPGEIAVPLAQWAEANLCPQILGVSGDAVKKHKWYSVVRDSLYRNVSNMITVRSACFAAFVRVEARHGDKTLRSRNYLAVFDRGNASLCERITPSDGERVRVVDSVANPEFQEVNLTGGLAMEEMYEGRPWPNTYYMRVTSGPFAGFVTVVQNNSTRSKLRISPRFPVPGTEIAEDFSFEVFQLKPIVFAPILAPVHR